MLRLSSPFNRRKNIITATGSSKNSKDENIITATGSRSRSRSRSRSDDDDDDDENSDSESEVNYGFPMDSKWDGPIYSSSDSEWDGPNATSDSDSVVWKGQTLDVIGLLSNHGETNYLVRSNGQKVALDHHAVLGKHLAICCVSLPMLSGRYYFNSMMAAYSDLSRDDFEIVLVAHVKRRLRDKKEEAHFNKFFSAANCLAIPFSDYNTRANICTFIGFTRGSICPDATAILLDPTQTILHYHKTMHLFCAFGSDWFPFLQTTIDAIETQDLFLRFRLDPTYYERHDRRRHLKITIKAFMKDPLIREPLSLHEDILLCEPSLVLPAAAANQQSITVSELSNKYVGLYICQSTMVMMPFLKMALNPCVKKEPELVIVVVCVPFYETIEQMQKAIKRIFEESNIGVATFFHPNNSKVWRRLWRVFAQGSFEDVLVILPPNCQYGELDANVVVEILCDRGYPFARSYLIERTFTTLRSLTPASLFKGTTEKSTCLIRNGVKSSVRQSVIKGKRLLLYLKWIGISADNHWANNGLCSLLMEQYCKIQAMGLEVVLVPLNYEDKGEYHAMLAKMRWPIMPFSYAVEALKLLFPYMDCRSSQIIAFEADGRMVSIDITRRLEREKWEFNDSLFYDNLYEGICGDLYSLVSSM